MEAAAERKLAVIDINRGRERVGVIIAAIGGRYRQPLSSVAVFSVVVPALALACRTGVSATPATVMVAVTGVAVGLTLLPTAASSVESAVKCTVSVPSYSPVGV